MAVIQLAQEASQDRPHAVRVTTLVERDFSARDVFPALRRQFAAEVIYQGNAAVFYVSEDDLHDLLEDAKARGHATDVPGALKRSYTAFANQLGELIRELRAAGTVPDPGIDAVRVAMHDSPARFRVGEPALICYPDGATELVEIVGGYALRAVRSEDGPYLTKQGQRIEYQHGYLTKAPGEEALATPAHMLTDTDGRPRHLVRVV